MKKLLFAAILGSMAMASCSNEDTVAPGAPSTDGSKSNLRIEMIVDGISTKGNTEGILGWTVTKSVCSHWIMTSLKRTAP